ncbi:MAG TPA: exo-alpha-sialidase [Armatimonadota bacterium]|nr:exo-alpha-sialidase [Armatimonadota bacterium]
MGTRRAPWIAFILLAAFGNGGRAMAQDNGPQPEPPKLEGVERSIAAPGGMFPVLQRLRSGALAAVVRGGAPHVGVGGLLNLVTSEDGGLTWSEPNLIVYVPPDTRDWAFGQADDGRLILAFCVTGAYTDGRHGFEAAQYHPWVTTSDDDGAQWSNPAPLDCSPLQYSALFGKIITLADGTVLLHGYGWHQPEDEGDELPADKQGMFNYLLRSTDDGRTWGDFTFIASQGYSETALCALPDGRILAAMRADGLHQSISADEGRTWSAPELLVEGARQPADVILLESGKLLLTFGRRVEPFGVEVVLSGDEYGTWDWSTHRLIEWEAPNTDCSYPSSAQLDDGAIVTLYYKVTDAASPDLRQHVQVWSARYDESDLLPAEEGVTVPESDAASKRDPITDLTIAMLDAQPVPLPTQEFSVRQVNALWHDGKHYIYADIIPWANPKHPDSYGSSIGAFSSPDGRQWSYHGEVVAAGSEGEWDYGGVATPGACTLGGRFYVAYSGREKKDGRGRRFLGLAVADTPLGPFRKAGPPIFPLDGHPQDTPCFDDPCLVVGPGGKLHLYYRYARWRGGTGGACDYTIRLRTSEDAGRTWPEPTVILRPENPDGVLETIEAKYLHGRFVLFVLDYVDGANAAMYVSRDGVAFERCAQRCVEDGDGMAFGMGSVCTRLPGLIPDGDGECGLMNAAGVIDEAGHFTQWIYRIRCQ